MIDTTPLLMLAVTIHHSGDRFAHHLANVIQSSARHRESLRDDRGQATTEYALVLLAAALVALLVVAWATAGGGAARVSNLFNRVIESVIDRV